MIALKVDVDTLRGTLEGVPKLVDIFERRGIKATFLFSLGPDHTGWAVRRMFRPGFLSKVSRTSVLTHYGVRTLMYGLLLPAPDIGRRGAAQMRAARRSGHECGIHAWDHVVWHDNARGESSAWTALQMQLAFDRYREVFGEPPATHGAAGWQMNPHAFRQLDAWGLQYASDGRGAGPYIPVVDGQRCSHVQLPTSLPTFDELIGRQGVEAYTVAQRLLALTASKQDHVFTLHAELEGGRLSGAFETLLDGWQSQQQQLGPLRDLHATLNRQALPAIPVQWGTVEGRSGELVRT